MSNSGKGIPTESLEAAGLQLMRQAGKPMERVKGRGKRYRLPTGETVNLRTSNDNNLVLTTDHADPDKAQRRLKGDYVVMVMPERQRTAGAVVAYFVPSEIAWNAVRSAHRDWLATNPNTEGDNRTWTIWFDRYPDKPWGGFAEKWKEFRLNGATSASTKSPDKNFIARIKREIAEHESCAVEDVRISIERRL